MSLVLNNRALVDTDSLNSFEVGENLECIEATTLATRLDRSFGLDLEKIRTVLNRDSLGPHTRQFYQNVEKKKKIRWNTNLETWATARSTLYILVSSSVLLPIADNLIMSEDSNI